MNSWSESRITGLLQSPVALHAVLDEISLGILIVDLERHILFFNRAVEALCGFQREETLGIACRYILRHKLCIQECPALTIGPDSQPVCRASDMINRDRQLVPVRVTVAPIKDLEGHLIAFLETVEDLRPLEALAGRKSQAYSFGQLIGRSPQMERIFKILPVLAQSDSSILITGETGTGKDLVAEAIHHASERSRGPFIKISCAALPETLLESELFGHRRGAFTGAVENKPGRFRLAHNGTVYLNEIGELPLSLQAKLLTFLDDRIVYPLGSPQGFQADVRVIAATHRNLERMVKEGLFREDLLFRLNVARVQLPPLRNREGDLRLLLDHFLNEFAERFRKTVNGFSAKALEILSQHAYPGNVRELRNIVEYAVNVCRKNKITPNHLPAYLVEGPPPSETRHATAESPDADRFPSARQTVPLADWTITERELILAALKKTGGRRGAAAKLLNWSRSTLWRKIRKHGLET